MSYRELPDSVTDLEERVLRTWREEDTFRRSLEVREGEPEFVFYEGPPTANGRPGVHHVIARTIKDLVARYRTMTGHHVTRIAGWDTHGLPVEIEAEEQLGISGKPEIEALGIGEFNATCRENLFTYKDEWERLSRRIGYWLDYENAYITCSADFVESVWWAISEIERRGLLYKGYKVLPYCPRCGTGLSSHEVAQGYAPRSDPSLYTLFPVLEGGEGDAPAASGGAEAADRYLLVWTTTPWTLVSNVAVAYGPDVPYVEVEARRAAGAEADGETVRVVLSRRRAEELARAAEEGEGAAAGEHAMDRQPFRLDREALEEARTVPPSELETLRYRRPLDLLPEPLEEPGRLHPADFVSDEEGTGFVHVAPAFGADDFELGRERDLPVVRPVDDEGRFEEGVAEVGGRRVKEADDRLVELLGERGLLFAVGRVQHQYPHCWRCDSPLLYMARDSWYVETTAVKDRLLEHNASVQWCPPEIGSGRMGEWLENNVDWALSRDRYWGTPLPIWECDEDPDHREVLGSYEELAERTGGLADDFDPHRPEIDRPAWACPEEGCEGTLRRVEGVADAWFDSGSMPYAQWHYPFENEAAFEGHFPADFIAEGVDQTRGWFYSLLALATILFDGPAYRAVVVNDLILDAEGQKMSKSRGNTVDPWAALERHGADAIRWFLISSSNPWIPKRWDPEGLGEVSRTFFDTLRNSYRFFALYAGLEGWSHDDAGAEREEVAAAADLPAEDRWLLSRLDTITAETRADLDGYELTRAARRLSSFVVDELSNWYVRRTRDRFWATGDAGEEARRDTRRAFATLHEALRVTSLLLAPFAPFLSDWLHRELTGGSAHVADFPEARGRSDPELEREMEDARELAALGRAARERKGVRVRQPLRTLKAVLPGGRRLSPEVTGLLREELNVREVEFLDHGDQLVALRAKPDYSELGPRFGSDTPAVAEAVEGLSGEEARRLREGERVTVEAAGREVEVRPEEVKVLEEARGDLAVGSGGGYLAALDPTIDEELRREGLARELVNRVQNLRREAGLEVADRIELAVAGPDEVAEAARAHRDYVAGETLAAELSVAGDDDPRPETMEHSGAVEIEGHHVRLGLRRSAVEAERAP